MTVKRWVAVCAALFLSAILASSGFAADYRLLQLNGNLVKWGKPTLGQGAVITWALLERRRAFLTLSIAAPWCRWRRIWRMVRPTPALPWRSSPVLSTPSRRPPISASA